MTLPNFLIIGAQKCGTTTLYDILVKHPEILMSAKKELNFFNDSEKLKGGLLKYSSYFDAVTHGKAMIGEASPGYICYPNMAPLIKEYLGDIKLVLILRDPIKRALSQYWDNRRHLSENLSFKEAVNQYLSDEFDPKSKGYFSRGVYMKFINDYLKVFPREKLHIMVLENLIKNPEIELKKLYDFLGVNYTMEHLELPPSSNSSLIFNNKMYKFFFNRPHLNSYLPKHLRSIFFFGKQLPYKYGVADKESEKILVDFYKPWNNKLVQDMGLDLSDWMNSYR